MRLLITASRTLTPEHYQQVADLIREHYPNATEIWHGGAHGGDQLAARYARENHLREEVLEPWYGKNGGRLAPLWRNDELVKATNCTLAIFNGVMTNGTRYTARKSLRAGHETTIADLWTGIASTEAAR